MSDDHVNVTMPDMQPVQFGKYIIERQLAEGGMAKVYKGRTKNNYGIVKPVAIKIMQKAYIHNNRMEKMFLHEASLAVQFHHQNVLGILDYGSLQGQCYVVMDFISGCSLLDFRQQAQQDFDGIPYAEILFIAKNITAGLDYAHRLKDAKTGAPLHLVHRDISPHNIMISREGDIKIIDFGVAKTNESQDRSFHSEEAGKLRYMSPEQVSFGDEVTQSSDIYSMGVTLWELVAGVRVYEGLSQAQILDAIRTQDLPDLRQYRFDCPDYLMQVIKKATHRDPQQRYKTASDFHKEVSFLLNTHFASYTQEDFRMKVEWALKPTIEAETAQLANLEQAQNINNGRLKIKDRTKTLFRSPYFVINPRYLYYLLFATAMYAVHYHQENKTIDWAESSVNLMTELRQFLHTGNKPKALPKAYAKRRDVAKQTISINTSPAGAKILINDKEYDETPATIDLPEGVQSRIVLRLEGYKDEHVTLNPNMTRVFFRLTPAN